ncbi:Methyltransferase-like protein 13 [Trichinella spiralis]|uniref:Methyltransferase-like protein 13 n=1 Tax=Trichinella spiralis TaxID=6334 RepID=A0A0V1B268_TRISP|nr:Methyltransferase-like protein 13 [Trichinella spiralis]
MRKEFSKLVRQTFLYSMIHKISINLGQYAICHNIAHEYPHRDPLGSHKQMPNGWHHYDSPTCMLEQSTDRITIGGHYVLPKWYGEYRKFGSVLMKYLKRSDEISQIGCGSSCLADSLYDNGFKNIVSIDIVRSVIRKQIYRNRKRRPELTFSSGDATKLEYADQLFSAVLDKGTIDAMMSWKTEKCLDTANAMFAEVDRVLKTNGRYIILSLWPLCAAQMVHSVKLKQP